MGEHDEKPAEGAIVARERELETILRIAAASRTRGGTVLVTGEAGVGKTTLLAAASRRLDGWMVVRVQADSFESDLSFSTADALAEALDRRRTISAPRPHDNDPVATGRTLLDVLEAQQLPVCIVLDDVQWIDPASSHALRFVVRRLEGQPILLLAAGREFEGDLASVLQSLAIAAPDSSAHVELTPFSAPETQELALALLDRNISRRTASQLTEASGGSPLLLTMLLRDAKGTIESALHPAGVDIALPATNPLTSTVGRAFDHASDGTRSATEVASVLGTPIPAAVFGTIVGLLGEHVDLDGARDSGLIRVYERDGVTMLEPKHALLADAVVTHLSLERRRAIHRAAAEVMSGHHALLHRVEAAERTDRELVAELVAASRDAADHGRGEQAMNYARSAVRLAPSGAPHDGALVNIGLLAMRLLTHQRIFDLMPAIADLPDSLERDVIMLELSTLTGDLKDAFQRAEQIMHDPAHDVDALLVKAHAACAVPKVQMATGTFGPVIEQVRTAREFLDAALDDPTALADPALRWMVQPEENLIRLLGWQVSAAARTGDGALMMQTMAELDDLLAHAQDSAAVVDALVVEARVRIHLGDLERVRSDMARANALIRRFPTAWTAGYARAIYAHVLFLLGEWDASLTVADTAVALALDETDLSGWPIALAVSTLVRAARGKEHSVRDRLHKSADAPHAGTLSYDADLPIIARAELARALGDPAEQLSATEGQAVGASGSTLGWLTYRIDALVALGRPSQARAELARGLAERSRWTPGYGSIAWLEGRVLEADGNRAGALESYTRACMDATAGSYPFPLAIAELDRARLLREFGSLQESAEALDNAAQTFRRIGAAPYLARSNAELAQLRDASRPASAIVADPSSHIDPFAALTTRERQVAHAIATGLTNREVAELLYVSVTTVNFHVRNILAKLGITSRRELRSLTMEQTTQRQQRPHQYGPVKN